MSKNMDVSKRKQSTIAGGLTSSAGIFFAKFIGLFYVVPYNSMLGTASNLAYYGVVFNIYSYLLNICTTGFPFAITTLTVKYSTRGDYQTSLPTEKLSASLMTCFGFGMMIIVVLFSSPLAAFIMPDEGDSVKTMQMVLMLIFFALSLVPLLSSIRGSYQGLKYMKIYALSQVLEQVAHVTSLLSASTIAAYALYTDQVRALYFGVISTSISAILVTMHLKPYDKKQVRKLRRLAKTQEATGNNDRRETLKEPASIAFPYLIVAILGYSDMIVNTLSLSKGLEAHGNTDAEILLISGSINYSVLELMSIPMILALGFSSAIIPHITTASTNHDLKLVRKNIRSYVDIVLHIGLPASPCLFVHAKPLYAILFPPGNLKNLELLADILSWFSIEAFLNTIGSIFTALLMAVGLRRLNIHNLAIMMAVKFSVAYSLLKHLDYREVVMSSIFITGILIILDIYALISRYKIRWKYTLHKLLVILLAMAALFVVAKGCDLVGLKGYGSGWTLSLLQLAVNGSLAMLVYFGIAYFFSIPQTTLYLDLSRLLERGRRRQANATG